MATGSEHGRLASRRIQVAGEEIHYRYSVAPPDADVPIVLVHGMASGRYFLPLAEVIAPRRRVYLPDLPGFGDSAAAANPLPLRLLARRLLLWLRACELPRAHFVGQSLGCNVLVEALAAAPEAAVSATLQGVVLAPEMRDLRRFTPRWLLSSLYELFRPEAVRKGQLEVHPKQRARLVGNMLRHRIEQRLPVLECPTLVLQAEDDPIVPRAWAERVAALIPQGQFQIVEGTTHTMSGRSPEAFWAKLEPFLAQSEARRNWTLR